MQPALFVARLFYVKTAATFIKCLDAAKQDRTVKIKWKSDRNYDLHYKIITREKKLSSASVVTFAAISVSESSRISELNWGYSLFSRVLDTFWEHNTKRQEL